MFSMAFLSQAVGGLILEKPVDKQDAYRMLSRWVGPGRPPGTRGTEAGLFAMCPVSVSIHSSPTCPPTHHPSPITSPCLPRAPHLLSPRDSPFWFRSGDQAVPLN